MYVLVVPKKLGERAKDAIVSEGLLDKSQTIVQTDEEVEFPLTRPLGVEEINELFPDVEGITSRNIDEDRGRERFLDPIDNIRMTLEEKGFSSEELLQIPQKWELVGDVLILRFPPDLEERKLVAEYGDEYREYQKQVSMFIPYKWLKSKIK